MTLADHPTVRWYNKTSTTLKKQPDTSPIATDHIKHLARLAGADDCGVAHIDAPDLAQEKQGILSIYPDTKTVISIVTRLNRENVRCASRDVSDHEFRSGFDRSNHTASRLSAALLEDGICTLSPSAGFPMDMSRWPGKMWEVSHKTVAVATGMGHLGHNRLLIHPDFGNFIFLGTLLIDRAVSDYDTPLDYNPCIQCKLCVAACPTGAIAPDGSFCFLNCMVHNYRDRLGGFSDWVENVVQSRSKEAYRSKVADTETVSMWQSLSYGICNKSSYCMAACPAGKNNIGEFLTDKKAYRKRVIEPLQGKTETIFVLPGSDALDHVLKKYPHKRIKTVGSGVRPSSVKGFFESLPLAFQKKKARHLNAVFQFTFTGNETLKGTVQIKHDRLQVDLCHTKAAADIRITSDAGTWLKFLSGEKHLVTALITRKIKIKGNPALMKKFAACFPL